MPPIAEFKLKRFFNQPLAGSARANLSSSLAEVHTLPDLLTFEPEVERAYAHLSLGYPQLNGSEELRARIASRYRTLSPEDVIVTSGSDDAFVVLFCALLEAGDHAVVQSPAYQPLISLAEWRGAAVSKWRCREEAKWAPSLDELEAMVTRASRMVVINTPHNPTGYTFSAAELQPICAVGESRGVPVIADEVYRELLLDRVEDPPAAADLSPLAVSIGSLTKAFGLPGLRTGWIATRNQQVLESVRRLRMHFNTYLPAPSEFLACLALRHAGQILERNRRIAAANRDQLAAFLDSNEQYFSCHLPSHGVIAYPRWLGHETAQALSNDLLQSRQLLLAPAECFDDGDRHVRFGFGTKGFTAALGLLSDYLHSRA